MSTRRQFTPQQKLDILRRHLLEGVPVSDLCDEHQLNPNVFCRGQSKLAGTLRKKVHCTPETGQVP